jgi:hypothetical protein
MSSADFSRRLLYTVGTAAAAREGQLKGSTLLIAVV